MSLRCFPGLFHCCHNKSNRGNWTGRHRARSLSTDALEPFACSSETGPVQPNAGCGCVDSMCIWQKTAKQSNSKLFEVRDVQCFPVDAVFVIANALPAVFHCFLMISPCQCLSVSLYLSACLFLAVSGVKLPVSHEVLVCSSCEEDVPRFVGRECLFTPNLPWESLRPCSYIKHLIV